VNNSQVILGVVFTTLLVMLLVAGVFIAIYVAGKQRMQQQIQLTEMALQFEQEMRKAETEIGEHTMQQVGHELHDNIGHLLTCIRVTMENNAYDNDVAKAAYEPIEQYLTDAHEQVRLLSRSLNRDFIGAQGLYGAINQEIDRLNKLGRLHITSSGERPAQKQDKNKQLLLFRIFQEIMTNALKHSQARNVRLTWGLPDGVYLRMEDDGRGFEHEAILNSGKASGLRNIIKRAELAGFTCSINSTPGAGCSFEFRQIPEQA
jgi:two-component system, NarL family, sensor kinase